MNTYPIEIAGLNCLAHYTSKVTSEAIPECGPTYDCGGEPACPAEIEVRVCELWEAKEGGRQLKLPGWLSTAIERLLMDESDVFEEALQEHEDARHGDPDEAYERRRDDPPPRGWDD